MEIVAVLEELDREEHEDKRTFEELKKIANTVFDCVQFTYDTPSSHEAGMCPVLDLQVYIDQEDMIKYQFYSKPSACKFVIPSQSAHSKQMKMSVLVEEGVRRMRNNSRGLDWHVRKEVMEEWARKLRRSGYPCTVRHQVIKEAVEKYERMCKVEDDGGRPVHRAREWQQMARRLEKELKPANWHKSKSDTEGISAPLIIDPTNGNLTKRLKETCANFKAASGINISVRERAGISLRSDAKSEPLRRKGCNRIDCLVCSGGKAGMCETNSVGYRITCESCLGAGQFVHYEGETGRNAYSRGLEHRDDLKSEKEDTPLWKHCLLAHNGEKQSFVMKPLRNFNSPLQRQANEGVRITASKATILMNSKNEWHQAPIIRVFATTGLAGDQGEDQIPVLPGGAGRGGGRGGRGGGSPQKQ